jgi:hypothetical protein
MVPRRCARSLRLRRALPVCYRADGDTISSWRAFVVDLRNEYQRFNDAAKVQRLHKPLPGSHKTPRQDRGQRLMRWSAAASSVRCSPGASASDTAITQRRMRSNILTQIAQIPSLDTPGLLTTGGPNAALRSRGEKVSLRCSFAQYRRQRCEFLQWRGQRADPRKAIELHTIAGLDR